MATNYHVIAKLISAEIVKRGIASITGEGLCVLVNTIAKDLGIVLTLDDAAVLCALFEGAETEAEKVKEAVSAIPEYRIIHNSTPETSSDPLEDAWEQWSEQNDLSFEYEGMCDDLDSIHGDLLIAIGDLEDIASVLTNMIDPNYDQASVVSDAYKLKLESIKAKISAFATALEDVQEEVGTFLDEVAERI